MTERLHALRKRHLAELLALTFGIAGTAHADQTAYVTSCLDDGSVGTLRSVVTGAIGGTIVDAYTQSNCSTITLTQGEIVLLSGVDISIMGHNGAPHIVAAPNSRVFRQPVSVGIFGYQPTMTLIGLTISGGRIYTTADSAAIGGCISGNYVGVIDSTVSDCIAGSAGSDSSGGAVSGLNVALNHSRIENSGAYAAGRDKIARGGGVYGAHRVECTNSTITGNHVAAEGSGEGGGVFSVYSVDLDGCTIDHNGADRGGGVAQSTTTIPSSIRNSTISSNSATIAGGGLLFISPVSFHNSTVAFNQTPGDCGGVLALGPITAYSSIFADNRSASPNCVDFYTHNASGANNLITVAGTSPAVPPGTISADPQLTPLADHGGPTFTHGLAVGSPAIDQGSNVLTLLSDQRGTGFDRVVGMGADIGAFERQADDEELFVGGFD